MTLPKLKFGAKEKFKNYKVGSGSNAGLEGIGKVKPRRTKFVVIFVICIVLDGFSSSSIWKLVFGIYTVYNVHFYVQTISVEVWKLVFGIYTVYNVHFYVHTISVEVWKHSILCIAANLRKYVFLRV